MIGMIAILFGFLPLAIWLYLLLFHHGFWRLRSATPRRWPSPRRGPPSWRLCRRAMKPM